MSNNSMFNKIISDINKKIDEEMPEFKKKKDRVLKTLNENTKDILGQINTNSNDLKEVTSNVVETKNSDKNNKENSNNNLTDNKKTNKKKKDKPKTIKNCPNCGAPLRSFQSECLYCQMEIRDIEVTESLIKFADGLDRIVTKELPKFHEKDSVLKTLVGRDFRNDEEKEEFEDKVKEDRDNEIANYITNFIVPNTKEDLIEFMVLSTSNVNINDDLNSPIQKAWISKMDQVYNKAKIALKDSSSMIDITEMYNNKKKEISNKKTKKILFIVGGICLYFLLMGLLINPYITIFIGLLLLSGFFYVFSLINGGSYKFGSLEIKKKAINIICIILILIGLGFGVKGFFFIDEHDSVSDSYYDSSEKKYDVNVDIVFKENLLFNKYDVTLTLYDEEDILYHGVDKSLSYRLPAGTHKLKFSGDGMSTTVKLKVKKDVYVKYEVSCHEDEIKIVELEYKSLSSKKNETKDDTEKITDSNPKFSNDSSYYIGKNLNDVQSELNNLGFSNITTKEVVTNDSNNVNNSICDIKINNEDIIVDKDYDKNDEIVLSYWKYEKKFTDEIQLPKNGTKLAKDLDSQSSSRVYYINVDGTTNKPILKSWNNSTVTDAVVEYLDYLVSNGFNVQVTSSKSSSPYSGYTIYESSFKVSSDTVSWNMKCTVQSENYVEYELDVYLK